MNYQKHFRKIVGLPLAMLLIMLVSMMLTQASTVVQAQEPDTLPAPPPITDYRFGIVQAYNAPEVAQAAGVGWTRAIMEWNGLQKNGAHEEIDEFYFKSGGVLEWKEKEGKNVEMVGLLINTPAWASRRTTEDGKNSTVPTGIDEPGPYGNESQNLWGRFVRKTIEKYRDHIDYWVVWNEPDICGGSWNGTEEEYVKLLKVAYQAKQEIDQDAKIVLAATTYWNDIDCGRPSFHYISKVLDLINDDPKAKENNDYFDVVGINLYLDPDQIYKLINEYRRTLLAEGYTNKEIWLTETNVQHLTEGHRRPPVPGGEPYDVYLEEQAHYLVSGWAMAMAAGAERIEFYKAKDHKLDADPGKPFGLQRLDDSLRPVFWTYRTIVTYLGHYTDAKLEEGRLNQPPDFNDMNGRVNYIGAREAGPRQVTVNRGELGTTTVVWSREWETRQAVPIQVRATEASALLVDSFGPIGTIYPVGGYYSLLLPAPVQPGDRAGGSPYLIVEGEGAKMCIKRPPADINNISEINLTVSPNGLQPLPPGCESSVPSPSVSPEPEAEASPEPTPEPEPEPTPEPEPLIPEGLDCSIEGAAYYLIPIDTKPDLALPDYAHPDLNLKARGYEEVQGPLGLLDYGGDADPEAPQLAGLFTDGRIPTFTSLYQVYDWNWEEYSPGGLLNDPWRPASLVGMETRQGEKILVPDRQGGAIYQGVFKAVVIYASENQITLKYTRDDDVVDGYTVHIENVCVDPVLLEMYRRENAAYRTKLPALEGRQAFGVATGREILVAIRDKGNFMDPRSRKDWWRENTVTSTNFSAVAPQAEQVPQVSTINSAGSAPAEVAPQVSTINSVTSPQKVVSPSRGTQYQFK